MQWHPSPAIPSWMDALCSQWQLQWQCAECTACGSCPCQELPACPPAPVHSSEGISSVPNPFPSGSLAPFQRTAGAPLTPAGSWAIPELWLLQKLLLKFLFPDTFLIPTPWDSSCFSLTLSSSLPHVTTLIQRHTYPSILGSPLTTLEKPVLCNITATLPRLWDPKKEVWCFILLSKFIWKFYELHYYLTKPHL